MTQWAGGQHPLLTALRHNPQTGALQAAAGRRSQMSQQAAQMKMRADMEKARNFQWALGSLTQMLQQRQQQKWRTEQAELDRTAAQKRAETRATPKIDLNVGASGAADEIAFGLMSEWKDERGLVIGNEKFSEKERAKRLQAIDSRYIPQLRQMHGSLSPRARGQIETVAEAYGHAAPELYENQYREEPQPRAAPPVTPGPAGGSLQPTPSVDQGRLGGTPLHPNWWGEMGDTLEGIGQQFSQDVWPWAKKELWGGAAPATQFQPEDILPLLQQHPAASMGQEAKSLFQHHPLLEMYEGVGPKIQELLKPFTSRPQAGFGFDPTDRATDGLEPPMDYSYTPGPSTGLTFSQFKQLPKVKALGPKTDDELLTLFWQDLDKRAKGQPTAYIPAGR